MHSMADRPHNCRDPAAKTLAFREKTPRSAAGSLPSIHKSLRAGSDPSSEKITLAANSKTDR